MSKAVCMECREAVDYWDVYVQYTNGCLCSSCVLQLGVSVADCSALKPSKVDMKRAESLVQRVNTFEKGHTSHTKECKAHRAAMEVVLKSA